MRLLHIANKNYSSWSLRPWILMQQLGIPFKEQLWTFEADNFERFRSFSPTGKVPCLVDGSVTVWDSLAIAEYLAEDYPAVWPADRAARAWARSACAEMHTGFGTLRDECSMNCGIRIRLHRIGTGLQKNLDRLDELWRDGLERFGGPWLAGEHFSAADAFFAPVAFRVQTYDLPLSPTSLAYAQRLLELPAMQQWQADGIAEPWVEEEHEAACLKTGTLLVDYRSGR